MRKNKKTLFTHTFVKSDRVKSKLVLSDSLIKVKYHYNKYNQMVGLSIKTKIEVSHLIHKRSLFLVGTSTKRIELIYTDNKIRVFRSKGKTKNYLITIT